MIARHLYYIAAAGMILVTGCSGFEKKEVVVIEKTKSYHTDECPRVNMARTKVMTIVEAQAINCKPCNGCKPDPRQ